MPLDTPAASAAFELPEATRELRETALAFAQETARAQGPGMGPSAAFPGRGDAARPPRSAWRRSMCARKAAAPA